MIVDINARGIRRLSNVVEAVRLLDQTLPIQTLAAFLYVASHEGENVNSVAQKVGMAQASASRNISALTDWSYRKTPGLKLVEYRRDPMNLTQKTLYLTTEGQKLLAHLIEIMDS